MHNPYKRLKNKVIQPEQVEPKAQDAAIHQRLILDALPAAVMVTRLDGSIAFVNRYFNEQFGFNAPQSILDFYKYPEERKQVIESIHQQGYLNNYELRARKADGSPVWVLLSSRPFEFEGQEVFLSSLVDITVRKQAEERLVKNEERYQNFISQSFEVIYRTEFEHPIDISLPVEEQIDLIYENAYLTECNQALADMYGITSVGDLIGFRLVDAHQGKDNPANRATFKKLIENGYHSSNDETMEHRLDGHPVWFLSNTVGIIENGHLTHLWGTSIDITERKRAEAQLGKEARGASLLLQLHEKARNFTDQELYAYVLDQIVNLTESAIGFLHFISEDQKTIILTAWNELALKNCSAAYDTHYSLEQAGNWGDCVRTKRPIVYNDFLNAPNQKGLPDGHTPLYRFVGIPVLDGDKVTIIFGAGNKAEPYDDQDILQIQLIANELNKILKLRRSEMALRESEARFRMMFRLHDAVMLLIEPETGQIIDANVSAEKYYGYPLETIKKMSINDINIMPPEKIAEERRKAVHEERNYFVFCHRLASGEVRAVEVHSSPIIQKGLPILFSIIHDITQRQQAEEALRASEETYRALLEAIPDIIMRFDVQGRHLFVSKNVEEVVDIPAADFIGKTFRELGFPLAMTQIWDQTIQKVFETGVSHASKLLFPSKHGGVIFDWRLVPEFDAQGKIKSILSISCDVTLQRQAEENYQTLFRAMLDGFALQEIICDAQGQPVDYRFLAVNPAFERQTGLQAEAVIGKTVLEVMPRTEKYWIETYGRVALTGEPVSFENYSRELEKHFSVTAFRYAPRQFVTIFADITERKQAEAKLARQIERLRVLRTIDQAVASSMDLNLILNLLVQKVVEQLQVDASAVLLLNPQTQTLDFAAKQGFQTEALEFTSLNLGAGLAGRAAQDRKVVYLRNLTEIEDLPTLVQAIVDEKFVTYIGVPLIAKGNLLGVLEIFHRTQIDPEIEWLTFLETLADQAAIAMDNARLLEITQQRLKETSALYRINQDLIATIDPEVLMENVVNMLQMNFGYYHVQIFVMDPKTGDFVVRAGSGELGRQLKNMGYRLAPGDGIVGFTAETGRPFFTNDVEQVISFVRPPLLVDTKAELAVPIKVGDRFLGMLDVHQAAPSYLTKGDVQLVYAVADQLAVALQKAELYADLQEALFQEQAVRSQLIHSEKLTVAGRLLASVSHELNNPIQAIQNALFLLKEERGISAQGKQDLEIVLSETERMASMLQRLRASYRPVSAEDFRQVQINQVIDDVCALVATHLRHSQIRCEFCSDPQLPPIFGLDSQLRQVILNLVMNSVDAMPTGGALTIATQFLAQSGEALITVSDTGPGIAKNILPNIFDAFVTNKERGTGLGLAISYEIVLKHHGQIQARNNPERGATISIWLPVDTRGNE